MTKGRKDERTKGQKEEMTKRRKDEKTKGVKVGIFHYFCLTINDVPFK